MERTFFEWADYILKYYGPSFGPIIAIIIGSFFAFSKYKKQRIYENNRTRFLDNGLILVLESVETKMESIHHNIDVLNNFSSAIINNEIENLNDFIEDLNIDKSPIYLKNAIIFTRLLVDEKIISFLTSKLDILTHKVHRVSTEKIKNTIIKLERNTSESKELDYLWHSIQITIFDLEEDFLQYNDLHIGIIELIDAFERYDMIKNGIDNFKKQPAVINTINSLKKMGSEIK